MANRDAFSSCHPAVNFLFFALVLVFTMIVRHPAYLAVTLISAVCYNVYLRGRRGLRLTLVYLLPLAVAAAVFNPTFNHEGATILAYFPSGNPLTLESMYYGLGAAAMLMAVVVWFSCYTEVMTSDKFVYLFGRIIPALSLVLSMTLRFIPKFTAQLRLVSDAQKCIGRSTRDGGPVRRLRNGVTIFSILLTWALENAIETADSMKSRGYGLPGRTAFSIYRFDSRDRQALLWLLFCGMFVGAGVLAGGAAWQYYPVTKGASLNRLTVLFPLADLALCMTPVMMDLAADRRWAMTQMEEARNGSPHS